MATIKDRDAIGTAADEAFERLRQLESPVQCGHAIAMVQAHLMAHAGLKTEAQVKVAMKTMTREVIRWFKELQEQSAKSTH